MQPPIGIGKDYLLIAYQRKVYLCYPNSPKKPHAVQELEAKFIDCNENCDVIVSATNEIYLRLKKFQKDSWLKISMFCLLPKISEHDLITGVRVLDDRLLIQVLNPETKVVKMFSTEYPSIQLIGINSCHITLSDVARPDLTRRFNQQETIRYRDGTTCFMSSANQKTIASNGTKLFIDDSHKFQKDAISKPYCYRSRLFCKQESDRIIAVAAKDNKYVFLQQNGQYGMHSYSGLFKSKNYQTESLLPPEHPRGFAGIN